MTDSNPIDLTTRKYHSFLFFELRYLEAQIAKRLPGAERFVEKHKDVDALGMDAASRAETVLRALGIDPHKAE